MKFIQTRQKIYNFSILETIKIFLRRTDVNIINNFFEKLFLTKKFIFVSQCRIGIYLSIKSILKKKKKEIILSPFTVFEVVNMVKIAGGIPVFADLTFPSAELNLKNIKKKISKNTAGVLFTQYHSYNLEIKLIRNYLRKKKIILIEDNAISFGCDEKIKNYNSDIRVYSFNITKFVSCLSGGIVIVPKNILLYKKILSESKKLNLNNFTFLFSKFMRALKIKFFTNKIIFNFFTKNLIKFGELKNIRYLKEFTRNDPNPITYKFLPKKYKTRVSNFQIKEMYYKVKNYNHYKNQNIRYLNYKYYEKKLSLIKDISFKKLKKNNKHGCLFFPFYYKERDKLYNYLIKNNVDVSKYYYRDCSNMEIFKKYNNKCINSQKLCEEVIIFPTYPTYKKESMKNNILLVKKFFNKK